MPAAKKTVPADKKDTKNLTPVQEKNIISQQQKFSTPAKKTKKLKPFVFKDNEGNTADPSDYFFPFIGEDGSNETVCPPYFNDMCGSPVDREDLLEIFWSIFDKKDGYLLYKMVDREVYVVIVPIHLSVVNVEEGAMPGDFQKHAMSFILEGSVNPTLFKSKLKQIRKSIRSLIEE